MANLAAVAPSGMAVGVFNHTQYKITRPFFTFFGREFNVFGPDGTQIMYVKHPMMKLRDEWNVFTDKTQSTKLLRVKAREAIALNITHDVFDAQTEQRVGTIRTRGLKSILRDTWDILDPHDQPMGLLQEDSSAILRRIFKIIPGKWHAELGPQGSAFEVARITQQFRFFTKEFTLDVSMAQGRMDTRLGLTCALLALMKEIERQDG